MLDLSASKQSCPPGPPPLHAGHTVPMRRGDPDRDPGVRWPQTARDNLCYLFILFLWSALHSFVAALAGGRKTGGGFQLASTIHHSATN